MRMVIRAKIHDTYNGGCWQHIDTLYCSLRVWRTHVWSTWILHQGYELEFRMVRPNLNALTINLERGEPSPWVLPKRGPCIDGWRIQTVDLHGWPISFGIFWGLGSPLYPKNHPIFEFHQWMEWLSIPSEHIFKRSMWSWTSPRCEDVVVGNQTRVSCTVTN